MSSPFDVIRRITSTRPPAPSGEVCEMCADPMGTRHQHVVNVEDRALMCVCRGCYLLFVDQGASLRYRAVPDRFLCFPDDTVAPADWAGLEIPVDLAFFFRNSVLGRMVAFYPGPAGAIESDLPLQEWDSLVQRCPELDIVAADVEALLIRMPGDSPGAARPGEAAGCLLLPIDVCYEFVGQVRTRWRGFDGGSDVHDYIDEFFTTMSRRAAPVGA